MPTALLVMDIQPPIVSRYDGPFLERIGVAIARARAAGVRVIFVRVGFRDGHPEVSERNRIFRRFLGTERLTGDDLHLSLDVAEGDVVVTKRRVSAFTGSDLAVVLRAMRIDHLALCGVATSGVVLSTVREAADRDFTLTVLADACADDDPEVHRVLLEKVFPRQATVVDVAGWVV